MQKAVTVRIIGRVQGVGFRYFVVGRARALNLCGSVRNMVDGSVEVLAEGEEKQLNNLLIELRHGPSGSRVDRCEVIWRTYQNRSDTFEVAH